MPRRPAAMIAAACTAVALVGAPAAAAQSFGVGNAAPAIDYPVLSELPPLPADGGESAGDEAGSSDSTFSGIQAAAFVLAGVVLVAGAAGLTLVTRRGRGEDQPAAHERSEPHGAGLRSDGPSR